MLRNKEPELAEKIDSLFGCFDLGFYRVNFVFGSRHLIIVPSVQKPRRDFFDPTGFCRLNHSSDFFDPSAFFDSTSFFRHRRNEKKRNALVSEQAKLKIDLLSELYNKLPNANQANTIVSKNQPTEITVAADKSRRWTASKTPLIKSGGATNPSNSPHARDCSVVSNTAYEMNETPTQIDKTTTIILDSLT